MLTHYSLEELEKQNGADKKSAPTVKNESNTETIKTDKPKRKSKAE